eukprot:GILK01011123.1.p1 GENE.GILK01011123.1~~GILK01011123.1.p1  ORF type:complete len:254 (-),score=61.84 GILK01011123.1:392-1090(-)
MEINLRKLQHPDQESHFLASIEDFILHASTRSEQNVKELVAENQLKTEELLRLQSVIENGNNENREIRIGKAALERQLNDSKLENQAMRRQLEVVVQIKVESDNLKREIAAKESVVTALKLQLESERREAETLSKQFRKQNKDLDELLRKLQEQEKQTADLKKKNTEIMGVNRKLQAEKLRMEQLLKNCGSMESTRGQGQSRTSMSDALRSLDKLEDQVIRYSMGIDTKEDQ